jgi:hypothetical protein
MQLGKYKITDKDTGHSEIVLLEHIARNGRATITMLPSPWGPRIDLSARRVASLNWEKVGK